MSNSLLDQLLKAGLVTQERIEQAKQPKPKAPQQKVHKNKPPVVANLAPKTPAPAKSKPKPASELEAFYKAREQAERSEREEAERRQREIALRRKQARTQIRTLINENQCNVEEAEVRYNFVIGENIKYLYVTEQQQQALADGLLAITFMDGKRWLIPADTAQQILTLDPDKAIIINHPEHGQDAAAT